VMPFSSTDANIGNSNDCHNHLQEENNIKRYQKDTLGFIIAFSQKPIKLFKGDQLMPRIYSQKEKRIEMKKFTCKTLRKSLNQIDVFAVQRKEKRGCMAYQRNWKYSKISKSLKMR